MTRREFLAKTVRLLAAISALVLGVQGVARLAGVARTPVVYEAPSKLAITLLAVLTLLAALAIPMIPGAIGGIIFPRRPRPAGAAAALLAATLWWLLSLVFGLGDVPHMSWLGWVINGALNVAWLAYFGSVGGAFAAAVRAGWREGRTRDSSLPA